MKYFFLVVIIFLSSCTRVKHYGDPLLDKALIAADENRDELEKVLNFYNRPEDSVKYKAAVFLIKYMPGKRAKVFSEYDKYKPVFDTLESLNTVYEKNNKNYEFYKHYKRTVFNYFMKEHNIKDTKDLTYDIKDDIKTVTGDFLIENIEYAFKAWHMPWNENLSFQNFCEFILPYRYGNEELRPWRKAYFESNKYLLDSLRNFKDPIKAAMFLKTRGYKSQSEMIELRGLGNNIRALDLLRINTTTTCKDETGVMLLRLRGLGIPVARLTVPIWGNRGSGHDINGIPTRQNTWFGFGSGPDTTAYKPPTLPSKFKTSKVYAEIYSANPNPTAVFEDKGKFKLNSGYIDVTRFIINSTNIVLPFIGTKDGDKACLLIFNKEGWAPIVQTTIYRGKAHFSQVGKDIIYNAGSIKSGKLFMNDDAFLLDSNGVIKPIKPSKNLQNLILTKKYPNNILLENMNATLNGCYFQGSNDSSFKKATLLWKIEGLKGLETINKMLNNANFQYVRLVFPNTERKNESLGGIQFYTKSNVKSTTLLKGEPISSVKASKTFYDRVFDNSPLTYTLILNKKYADFSQFYNGENLVIPDKTFWIGLKFKSKVNISSIGFSPRTDDNDINIGDKYGLAYWNNNVWTPVGEKISNSNKIDFNGPKNALYVLTDINKGNEQRIFLYENSKQIWY